jgi:hypothetical protein
VWVLTGVDAKQAAGIPISSASRYNKNLPYLDFVN